MWKTQQEGNNLFTVLTLDRTKHHKLPEVLEHIFYGGLGCAERGKLPMLRAGCAVAVGRSMSMLV